MDYFLGRGQVDARHLDFVDDQSHALLSDPGPVRSWEPPELRWGPSTTACCGRPLRRGPVHIIDSSLLVLVEDCRARLTPLLGPDGEFLPAVLGGARVWLYRCVRQVEAHTDDHYYLSPSIPLRHGDRLTLKFFDDDVPHAFHLKGRPRFGMYLDAGLKTALEDTGLFGAVEFRPSRAVLLHAAPTG